MPIHSRVDWRLDSLVSERHKLVESGYFDRALLVYGRGGQECVRCGTEIAKMTIGGRGSHFCPQCQKPPRYR